MRDADATRPSCASGATLTADAVALIAASLLAVWAAASFGGVPVVGRLITPFETVQHGEVLVFILLTPFWLATFWAFGLYREIGAQHRRHESHRAP